MLATQFGTVQDVVHGCGEGENKLISLKKAGASTLMNPVETISIESTLGKQVDARPLHSYPCYWPKNVLPVPHRAWLYPINTLHLAMPLCPSVKHALQEDTNTHTSNNKQLLLWVLLTWHTKLWFVIQCFWSRTSMNFRYQSSSEALTAPGFPGTSQVFL